MTDTLWHLTRSSGTVALLLITASLITGFFFSSRSTGNHRRPKWWLDLHNYLGGLALVFTLLHLAVSFADSISRSGLAFLPLPISSREIDQGMALGYLAAIAFAAVVLTSWPRKRLRRKGWLLAHVLSVPAAVLAALHGWMIGSSRGSLWFGAMISITAGLAVYPAVLRLVGIASRHWPGGPGLGREVQPARVPVSPPRRRP